MYSVGIDLDSEIINIAILNKHKEIIDIKYFDEKEINDLTDVNPLYISKNQKMAITSGLEIQDVLIKNIPFNIKKTFLFKKAIKFQNEFITQIDPSKTVSASIFLKNESQLKFFITTKDLLTKHLNRLNNFKIDPDYISCCGMALCRFASYFFKETKNAFLVHIGLNKTSCVFMKNAVPDKMYSIKTGIKDLQTKPSENKSSKHTLTDALSTKNSSKLTETLTWLKNEIIKALMSFTSEKYPLLLTGSLETFINLDQFLKNEKTTVLLNSEKLEKNTKLKKHAISIGLALCVFYDEAQSVQFRNGDFASNKKIVGFGKKLFIFCVFILILLTTFYFVSASLIARSEKKLLENLKQLEEFEKKELNNTEEISADNIYKGVDKYEKKLLKENTEFPFFLKIPNVSQALSWINNHEHLKNTEIISFNYELEQYPNVKERNSPYTGKIELEFKTKTPAAARCFYDSLIQGEGLVDPKEGITWDVGDNHYKTSFYLKTFKGPE